MNLINHVSKWAKCQIVTSHKFFLVKISARSTGKTPETCFSKMADADVGFNSLEGILNCPVCFEDYGINDDNAIPRLLPCSHTLCGKCTRELIQKNSLQCPECRKYHPAENGTRSFPQNKYILSTIRRKTSPTDEKPHPSEQKLEKCPVHDRELALYCSEATCQNAICSLCITSSHRGHNVVDLMQLKREKYESFVANANCLKEGLKCSRDKLVSSMTEIEKEMETCLEIIKNDDVKHNFSTLLARCYVVTSFCNI